ncbi:hypothetical protein F5882DRAFT_417108 [Hyaloscypha sp. PMI_1271]|nr:hypothetical protein F5882DRAFT_417108 [Hyaloscypha sp. PMI_1271]
MTRICAKVGNANPDIAGIGILLSFGIQAFLAIAISVVSSILGALILARRNQGRDPEGYATMEKMQVVLNEILLRGSDVQSVTGVALLISAISQVDSLPFYHLHIVYDTISLVAISIAAAVVCSFSPTMPHKALRLALILLWAIMYLTYTILFGVRLRHWDCDIEGLCYNSSNFATPNASHPHVDNIYVSITCFWVFLSLLWSLHMFFDPPRDQAEGKANRAKFHNIILGIAALQFPLHVYSMFTLHSSNNNLLTGGSSEQEWGFGQIMAVMLLATNLVVLVNGYQEYRKWKKSSREERGAELNESFELS